MAIEFAPLFSGSKGNSTFISGGGANILVDAGVTALRITNSLGQLKIDPYSLDGILITHEHTDHIKAAGVLSRRYDIPIYANNSTWKAMQSKIGDISLKNTCEFFGEFMINDMMIEPFCIPHDAKDPVNYTISYGKNRFSILTDLGHYTKKMITRLEKSDVVILESNHDIDMLNNGKYPEYLKKRILGTKGHLSNYAASNAAYDLVCAGVRGIMLGHLSENNNTESLAYKETKESLENKGVVVGKNVALSVLQPQCKPYLYRIGDR